jgi:hypothetical protein
MTIKDFVWIHLLEEDPKEEHKPQLDCLWTFLYPK